MSEFFINRPIVAMVIAILTVIVGAVTIVTLPIAQFPSIVPPEVQIQATYVGADAETLAQSVATPIEQQMSGVDNMNYMYSLNATGNGQMTMIVDFDVKTDPNQDLILAQSAREPGRIPASLGRDQLRRDRPEIRDLAAHAHQPVFPEEYLRCKVPVELRLHQLA